MASIPSNGYNEVMSGSNNYTGTNSFDGNCPQTPNPPTVPNDLCNKTYVDSATGGGVIGGLTQKGSFIVGDGTAASIWAENPYETSLITTTIYDWTQIVIGQPYTFTTTEATALKAGYEVQIIYGVGDNITGTVTAVVGNQVTINIASVLFNPAYSTPSIIYSAPPKTAPAWILWGSEQSPTFFPNNPALNPLTSTFVLQSGTTFLFGDVVSPNNFIEIRNLTTDALIGTSNPFNNTSPRNPTAPFPQTPFNFLAGVVVNSGLSFKIKTTTTQLVNWAGNPDDSVYSWCGEFSGYTLPYNTGTINLLGNLAILASPSAPQGVNWGVVNAASIGAVTSVSGGTNIAISGSLAAPVVNLRNPLTAELNVGTQSLRDRTGAVGTSGQVITAGTGGQVLWATPSTGVSSVTATPNANITIDNTNPLAPTVGVSNPCNATLALGTQDLTAVNGFDTSTINAVGIDTSYFQAGVASSNADLLTTGGDGILLLSSSNLAVGQGHQLTVETTQGGAANITHTTVGGGTARDLVVSSQGHITLAGDNVDLSSTGRLVLPSLASGDYFDYNAGSLKIVNDSVAGSANPLLVLQNNNNTAGATTFETYKNDQPTSTGGDNIASWSATCNTNVGKTEISRINHIAYGVGASNNDGGIALTCKVNSTISNFLICNGGSNEVQVFKTLDMNGNAIETSSGNLTVDGTTSSGDGSIFLNPKTGAGGYVALNNTGASNLRLDGTIHNLTAPTKNSIDMSVGTANINQFTINRNLVQLEWDTITNDVSRLALENNPSVLSNQIAADYLVGSTGELAQTIISTTPTQHRVQLVNVTQAKGTNIYPSQIELGSGTSLIELDAAHNSSGVSITGGGTDGVTSNGNFSIITNAGTQEYRLTSTDLATSLTKTILLDNNTAGDADISYTNNTADGAGLNITSNTDVSIATVGGSGNSVFIDALNEVTVSSTNQLSLKVATAGQPITFEVNNSGGYLNFVGTDLLSGSSSGNSGQHLVVTINGVGYKIALENP